MKLAAPLDTDTLSLSEKILLVQDLWDEIALANADLPLSENLRAELAERYEDFLRNPEAGSSWEEVKWRILGKL